HRGDHGEDRDSQPVHPGADRHGPARDGEGHRPDGLENQIRGASGHGGSLPVRAGGSTGPSAGGPYRRRMTLPVMSRAASDARYATTPATSAGEATVNSTVLSATIRRTASLTQPVSVTPGWTMFAVTP